MAFFTNIVPTINVLQNYLKPENSPYFYTISIGIVGLYYVCSQDSDKLFFLLGFMAISIVLTFLTIFTLLSGKKEQQDDSDSESKYEARKALNLSRSIGITVGIICIAIGTSYAQYEKSVELTLPDFTTQVNAEVLTLYSDEKASVTLWNSKFEVNNGAFWVIFSTSVVHLVVFLWLLFARIQWEENFSSLNLSQITLVTSSFLFGATLSIFEVGEFSWDKLIFENDEFNKFSFSSAVLYVFWLLCQAYWIRVLILRDNYKNSRSSPI